LNGRVGHIEFELVNITADIVQLKADVALLKADVAQLKADVAQLKADVAQLKTDVTALRMDLAALSLRFDSELPHLATKADLCKLEARMKAWGMGLALSVITINTGVNFAMYSSLKSHMLARSEQGARAPLALTAPAPAPR
jgi:outer membrane murein-binding lipoprotein Lpp